MKIKALRKKDTKEFIQIIDDSGKAMVYTSELPNPQPMTADMESLTKYFDKYSDQININDFELVEFDVIEVDRTKFDYEASILKHQKRVNQLINMVIRELLERASCHDNSKLYEPEKSVLEKWTPKQAPTTYGSKEYFDMMSELKVALDHHYDNNTHHPEHYENGMNDMDLFDLIEMVMDWMASVEKHIDGDKYKSLEVNKKRFMMSDQLVNIIYNTYKNLDKKEKDE